MKMKKLRQIMAMFLCILMVMKLAVPTIATATNSNAESKGETPHIVLNTEADLYEVASESNAQEQPEEFVPESSGQNEPEDIVPESSAQGPVEESEPESSGQDATDGTEEVLATPSNATCQVCGTEPCACVICKICGEKNCKEHPLNILNTITDVTEVGDIVWIINGSYVYKDTNDEDGYELKNNYEIKITEIIVDENNNPIWYKFKFNDLGVGEIILAFGGYNYVRVENVSVEELAPIDPTEEFACNCGENAPENLADHADSCPRKQYVKSLFEDKSAGEIYAEWENYDKATQTDLLNMLQRWDNTKYEDLNSLINDSVNENVNIDGTEIYVLDIPKDVSLTVDSVSESHYHRDLEHYLDENSELLYAYDITLTNPDGSEWQPDSGKSVTVTLDFKGAGLPDGNKIKILHEHDGELNALGEYEIEDGKLTFTTEGFSKFYFYITYTFGGYSFTMSGESKIYLSDLLRELAISQRVEDVYEVHFSNPDVLKITEVDSDWELESLAPFGSEEILTVIFTDGERVEISVKDPAVYNYAVGNEITNVPLLATKEHTVERVDNGDIAASGKKYIVNAAQITVDNVKTAGAAEKTAGVHPAPDTIHMVIYAREGMAIDFIGGTDWNYTGSKPTYDGSDIWFWSWESSVKANYVVVKDGTAGKQAKFTVTTTVESKKYYCNVVLCVIENSNPTLLIENLPDGYSIKNVPVTLYNYDGKEFNEYYNKKSGNYFAFSGTTEGVVSTTNAGNRGWTESGLQANGGGGVALMGIVKDTLVNGLPEMSQGQKVDVFSQSSENGKTVYSDVNFQFVYNDSTGYYTYNSALNHAQYNSEKNTIELYKQSLGPSDTPNGSSHGNAGFYPFEDINKAYTNTGYSTISQNEWINKLENHEFELIPSQYSTDIVETSSTNPASTVDLHYGIQVASDFYLPEGKQLNGNDMIYEFTGDDDLWVFIDGKLVLDIGGGHTYVSGSFNMTTGEVWVEKYTKLAAADGGSYSKREQGTDLRYTDQFLTSLQDDQMHTIQIFYLERHAGVSNCRMRFNLPLVPSDAVNVSKNLTNQDGEELSVTPDVSYTFTLYTAEGNDDNVDATNFSEHANKPYTVTGSGAPTETQYTDEYGKFVLKDGWIASFSGIPRFTEVCVKESNPEDNPEDCYIYSGSTVSVNKGAPTKYEFDVKTEPKVMQLNTSISFDFVNKMKTQPLTVEKQVVNGTVGLIDPEQKFAFTLDFIPTILESGEEAIQATSKTNEAVALTDNEAFSLAHDESITIPRVPVNMTFTLKESNPDQTNNSFDAPKFEYSTCTLVDETVKLDSFGESYEWKMCDEALNQITVTNQQSFNLTITKNGISVIDHHDISGTENEERQSTLYKVVGKIDNKVITEMKVAICGNSSVTICKLPVGSYTVVEDGNWSWRYEPDCQEKAVEIPEDAKASVIYTNTRNMLYWLSGDSYCENWFHTDGIKKRDEDNVVIQTGASSTPPEGSSAI